MNYILLFLDNFDKVLQYFVGYRSRFFILFNL